MTLTVGTDRHEYSVKQYNNNERATLENSNGDIIFTNWDYGRNEASNYYNEENIEDIIQQHKEDKENFPDYEIKRGPDGFFSISKNGSKEGFVGSTKTHSQINEREIKEIIKYMETTGKWESSEEKGILDKIKDFFFPPEVPKLNFLEKWNGRA